MVEIKGFPGWRTSWVTGVPRELQDEPLLIPLSEPRSPVTERYRRLKTFVEHIGMGEGKEVRTLLVSSSREGEGKTLTAFNLALVFAEERDRSVILVDGDLHRPEIHRLFRVPPRVGLLDLCEGKADLESSVVPLAKSRLHVLPAGTMGSATPSEILKSTRFREIFDLLRQRYDRVVIDTPPIMRFVDANIMNEYADGMLFVVRANLTARQTVRKALASVTSGRVLGLVFNDVRYTLIDRYYYRYDEYGKSYYDE